MQMSQIKKKKNSALRLQQGSKSNYKGNECQDEEAKLSQTGVLKGFMSLSFSRIYEKLHFCLLFQITEKRGVFFF